MKKRSNYYCPDSSALTALFMGACLLTGNSVSAQIAVPTSTTNYNTWSKSQAALSHTNPAVFSGTYTLGAIAEIYGHSALVSGSSTSLTVNKNSGASMRVGQAGSLFSGTPDSLTITDGATLRYSGRFQIGFLGDAVLNVTNGAKIVYDSADGRLVIGDSRDSKCNGRGLAVFEDSRDDNEDTFANTTYDLSVSYYGDGELRLTNSELLVDRNINISEATSTAHTSGRLLMKNSTLKYGSLMRVGYGGTSSTLLAMEGSTLLSDGKTLDAGIGSANSAVMNLRNSNMTVGAVTLGKIYSGTNGQAFLNFIGGGNTFTLGSLTVAADDSRVSFLADDSGMLSSGTVTGNANFQNSLYTGFVQHAGWLYDTSFDLLTAGGTISNVNGESGIFTLTNTGKKVTAALTPAKNLANASADTPLSAGWVNITGEEQSIQTVTLSLTGGDTAARQALVSAMNAANAEGTDYFQNSFTLSGDGNSLQYRVLVSRSGSAAAGFDFSQIAPNIQVTGFSTAAGDYEYVEMTQTGSLVYADWTEENIPSNFHPARISGGKTVQTSDKIMEIYGHSLYVSGKGTTLDSRSGGNSNEGLRVGGPGSSFNTIADRLVVEDGAKITSVGRVEIGMYGDGEFIRRDSSAKFERHLVIGDSRENPKNANGRVLLDNSQVVLDSPTSYPSSLTVGYLGKHAELRMINNSSILINEGNFRILENCENNGTASVYIEKGSRIESIVNTEWTFSSQENSSGVLNLDGGTIVKKDGTVKWGDGANSNVEINAGNGAVLQILPANNTLMGYDTSTVQLNLIGGENQVEIKNLKINAAKSDLNFYADDTGLSTVALTGTPQLNGKVNVGLAGGLALMQEGTYTILTGVTDSAIPASSSIWTLTQSGSSVTASLDPALKFTDTPLNAGWLELSPDPELQSETLTVELEVTGLEGEAEYAAFLDWLNTDGYLSENAEVETVSGNISLNDFSFIMPYVLGNDGILAFDFSGYSADVLLNSATLTGIAAGGSGSGVPEPSTWILLVLGCGFLGWTRKRRNS